MKQRLRSLERREFVDTAILTLSVLIVMPPQRADFVLTADVPHSEVDRLVLDGLHVEPAQSDSIAKFSVHFDVPRNQLLCPISGARKIVPNGWNCGDHLPQFQLV